MSELILLLLSGAYMTWMGSIMDTKGGFLAKTLFKFMPILLGGGCLVIAFAKLKGWPI